MAKKTRYPRKLRQTIEKIAAARDEREARADEPESEYSTLWQDFIPRNSVHLVHTKVDEMRQRIISTFMMEPQFHHPRTFVRPPWDTEPETEGDASE